MSLQLFLTAGVNSPKYEIIKNLQRLRAQKKGVRLWIKCNNTINPQTLSTPCLAIKPISLLVTNPLNL
jgi:hypothetical protein